MDLSTLIDHAAQPVATESYQNSHGIPHSEYLICRSLTHRHHTRLRARPRREVLRHPDFWNRSPTPAGRNTSPIGQSKSMSPGSSGSSCATTSGIRRIWASRNALANGFLWYKGARTACFPAKKKNARKQKIPGGRRIRLLPGRSVDSISKRAIPHPCGMLPDCQPPVPGPFASMRQVSGTLRSDRRWLTVFLIVPVIQQSC